MKSLIVLFLVGLNFPTCDLRSLNHKQQSENEMVVMSLPPKTEDCGKDNYKHKSEAEIAQLTPAQRVDEYAEEQAHHKYDVLDEHSELIAKYILRDGLKILPRTIEIMNEYDPTHASGKSGNKGERFDAMWMLLGNLDENIIRLRGKEDGKRALEALERAIVRMKAADYGQPDQHDWERHGRFELAVSTLEETKGINETDEAIKDTFRLEYKILLSNLELLAFSNFLTAQYPEYPSSSETNYFRDYTQINEAGNPLWVRTLKKPKCYYEAYLEFKKTKRGRKPDDPNRQGAGVYGHILMQAGAHLAGRPVMAITGYLVDGLQLAFSRPQSSEEMAGNYAGPPVGRQMWNYLTGGRDKDELRKSLTNELCE